jgi:hypothetical protein
MFQIKRLKSNGCIVQLLSLLFIPLFLESKPTGVPLTSVFSFSSSLPFVFPSNSVRQKYFSPNYGFIYIVPYQDVHSPKHYSHTLYQKYLFVYILIVHKKLRKINENTWKPWLLYLGPGQPRSNLHVLGRWC